MSAKDVVPQQKLTPAQRDAVKAEVTALGATARTIWQALLDTPVWTVHDMTDDPPQLWHTRVVVTGSETP